MTKYIDATKVSTFVIAIAIALLTLSLPAFSYAATYLYVNQSGQLSTVVANSPTDAIRMAPNIAAHSGVMLAEGSSVGSLPDAVVIVPPNSSSVGTYAYVNTAGVVVTVNADSAAMAIANAVNKDEHSGVVLLSNTSTDIALVGDRVSGV